MKNLTISGADNIFEIESRFKQLFEFFHKSNLRSEEHFVALYILFIYWKRLDINIGIYNNSNIKVILPELENHSKTLNSEQANKLNDFFRIILEKLDRRSIEDIKDILSGIDHDVLSDNFSQIFDKLLYDLTKYSSRLSGEFTLPLEISRFMCNLVQLPLNGKVYNPFAGLASFAVFLDSSQNYLGQELNLSTWAIGTLRVLANERKGLSNLILGDSFTNWNPTNLNNNTRQKDFISYFPDKEKFDLIISNPPFGLRNLPRYDSRFGTVRSVEHFLIENSLDSLNEKGKMIFYVTQGFLFRNGSEHNIRKYLIENDLLEMVISLPSGMLMNTGVLTSIVVISKQKKEKGKVRFIDAVSFVESSNQRNKKLNDIKLDSEIYNSKDSDVLRIVSNETIAKYDFNLNVPRYFQEEFYGAKLSDTGSFIRGRRISEDQKGKYVRIRDLKDDKLDFKLSVDLINEVDLPRYAQCIEESCIIMALRWKTLKPTFFNYVGTPIFLTPETIAFKVDESKLNPAFFINELHSDYVFEQLNAYRIGETIPTIRRDDLLKVKIKLPSIEEQLAKIAGILEISSKINQLQAERNALAHGFGQRQFNEFASLKHTLGTPNQNILSYAETLISFFENNLTTEYEKISRLFREKMGVELISVYQAIKHDVNFISELLEKGKNGLILKDFELPIVPLQQILKYIQQLCNNHNYNFSSIPPSQIHDLAKKEADSLGIRINLSLVKILFDNIFSNAHKYAFEKKQFSLDQKVIIELGITEEGFFINILNNGKPFPKNMNKEKFITKYKTSDRSSGTGLGGYDINRIAEYFESEWFLKLNQDPLFPVQFSFWFKPLLIK